MTPETSLAKPTTELLITCLAATIMLLLQIALGYGVAALDDLPATDRISGILAAIGRSFTDGPVALWAHAGLGLILIITGVSVIVRAILARRFTIVLLGAIGLCAILASNVTGARFVDTGEARESYVMAIASLVSLVSYVVCLVALRPPRPNVR
jgi:hypothetical protein